jgi:hypothetical protein
MVRGRMATMTSPTVEVQCLTLSNDGDVLVSGWSWWMSMANRGGEMCGIAVGCSGRWWQAMVELLLVLRDVTPQPLRAWWSLLVAAP